MGLTGVTVAAMSALESVMEMVKQLDKAPVRQLLIWFPAVLSVESKLRQADFTGHEVKDGGEVCCGTIAVRLVFGRAENAV